MEHSPKQTLSWTQPEKNSQGAGRPTSSHSFKKSSPGEALQEASGNAPAGYWLAGAFVVGLIIGMMLGWAFGAYAPPTPAKEPAKRSSVPPAPASGNTAETPSLSQLQVPSPQKAGESVTLSRVSVGSPTWVVVYENRGGQPGNALGAQLFAPEVHSGAITLLRPTLAGQTYLVGERRDNGDRIYTPQTDMPIAGQDGAQLLVQFIAQ